MEIGKSDVSAAGEKKSFENDKPFYEDSERPGRFELPPGLSSEADDRGIGKYYDSERPGRFELPEGLDKLRLPEEGTDKGLINNDVRREANPENAQRIPGGVTDKGIFNNDAIHEVNPDEGTIAVSARETGGSERSPETKDDASEKSGGNNPEQYDDGTRELTDELCDDNGKQYRTESGERIPNNTYVLDEITYKTDDNGNIYCVDGKLQPNTTYELNGSIYTTDEKGRIIKCEAKPVRSPENPRDIEAQRHTGGEDRRPNDQGGHIVGRDMNGDGGIGNLSAMDYRINQSDYKRMENDIKTALGEGKDVTTKTEITYNGDYNRPDKITVTVTIDGRDTVYKFDNNLDGSLMDEVPENGKEIVKDRLNETGGEISSIKEEYDEDGNLVETTVCITYTGEDGTNYRTAERVPRTPLRRTNYPSRFA